MNSYRDRLILVGSLVVVFASTLVYGYGPGYGANLLGVVGIRIGEVKSSPMSPKMSPSDMVTSEVTSKKMVTTNHVTNVTSVSPRMSPSISTDASLISPTIVKVPSPAVTVTLSHTATPTMVSPAPITSTASHTPGPSVTSTPLVVSPTTPTPTALPSPMSTDEPSPPAATSTPAATQSAKIDINTAALSELDNITGVGPVIAQRIIDYRTANGPFQTIQDIIKVKGIGDATFQKMKDEITI